MAGTGNDPNAPWGWVPSEWLNAAEQQATVPALAPMPVVQTSVLQPGLGIPTATIDDAVAAAQANALPQAEAAPPTDATADIEMPNIDVADPNAWAPPAPVDAMPPEVQYSPVTDAYEPLPMPAPQDVAAPAPDLGGELELENVDASSPAARDAQAGDYGKYLSGLSDEDLMLEKQRSDQEAQLVAARRIQEESLKNYEAKKANVEAREEADKQTRAKMETLASEATRLSQTKTDPKRWWHNESTGSKILAVISAFTGGLAAPSMGGRNIGLEMIRKNIDEDIAAQMADLQNARSGLEAKRGAVADQFRQHGDALLAAETIRAASWENVVRALQTEQMNYDPRGTLYREHEIQVRQARAQQAASVAKYQKEAFDTHLKAVEAQRKLDADAESKRAALEREKTARYGIASENARASNRLAFDEKKWGPEAEKLNAEVDKLRSEGKTKEAERVQKFGIPGVVTPDGKPFVATSGSETGLENLRDTTGITRHIVRQIDLLKSLRTGWSSKTANSEQNQRIRQIADTIDFDIVRLQKLGVISSEDAPRIKSFRGFDEPDQWKSMEAGLDQFRDASITLAGEQMKSHGYPGEYTIKDFTKDQAKFDPNSAADLRNRADEIQRYAMGEGVPPEMKRQILEMAWAERQKADKIDAGLYTPELAKPTAPSGTDENVLDDVPIPGAP